MTPTRFGWTALCTTLVLAAGCSQTNTKPAASPPEQEPQVLRDYWPNGELRVEREVTYDSDGTPINDGQYRCWYINGQLEYEATYVDGQIHGRARRWHKNGRLAVEEHFDHGLRHGTRKTWDTDGLRRKQEAHVHGKPHGTWYLWNKEGEVKWRGRYERGVPVQVDSP